MLTSDATIVGVGAVSAYGIGVPCLMGGLATGKSAIAPHPTHVGSRPDDVWFARVPVEEDLSTRISRFSTCFDASVEECIADARARGWVPGSKVAMIHGTAWGDLARFNRLMSQSGDQTRLDYIGALATTPTSGAAARHDFHGPVFTMNGACATGLCALSLAQRMLTCDDATDVVVCSTELAAVPAIFEGLECLGVLLTDEAEAAKGYPLTEGSEGFFLGEGAAAAIVTSGSNQDGYFRLGSSIFGQEGHHPISIDPEFGEIQTALDEALDRAGVTARDIKTFIPHGTATPQCNRADLFVLEQLTNVSRVLAPKARIGHCRGAASLLETIILASAVASGVAQNNSVAAIEPMALELAEKTEAVLPCLHMSLGAGGNIGMVVYRGR